MWRGQEGNAGTNPLRPDGRVRRPGQPKPQAPPQFSPVPRIEPWTQQKRPLTGATNSARGLLSSCQSGRLDAAIATQTELTVKIAELGSCPTAGSVAEGIGSAEKQEPSARVRGGLQNSEGFLNHPVEDTAATALLQPLKSHLKSRAYCVREAITCNCSTPTVGSAQHLILRLSPHTIHITNRAA